MEKQNAAPKAPGEQQLDGIGNNAKTEDFRMKNKVYEIIKYGNIALKDFPKYERATLAREIRQSMYTILRLVITLENKHYKKTTLGELDTEVDVLRHFIRLAADEEMYPDKSFNSRPRTGGMEKGPPGTPGKEVSILAPAQGASQK